MKRPNQSSQPIPGERLRPDRMSLARHGWTLRSANEATMIPSTARFTSQFCRAAALSLRSARNLIAAFLVAGTTHVLASSVDLRVVGRWLTPSFAEDLAVDGQYAYVADYLEGLQVVSISDPTSPQKVGVLSTGGGAWGIALSGTYAYVADDKSGLQVVDVSNPVAPRKAGEWTNAPCTMVRIFGDTAFVETSLVGSGRVRVLDLSDPRNPAQIASVDYVPQTIESGGRAYASDLYLGLVVLDSHDLTNPQTLGSYDTGPGKPSTTSVAVSGSYAFVTDNDFFGLKGRGLVILDVNDPSNPQQVWEQPTSASADLVAVAGQRAFVASHGWGSQVGYFQTFDVGNPREAALLGGFMVGTVGPATAMVVEGSYVYLAVAGLTMDRWSKAHVGQFLCWTAAAPCGYVFPGLLGKPSDYSAPTVPGPGSTGKRSLSQTHILMLLTSEAGLLARAITEQSRHD